jgi:predicted RNase H-like HicB family nuclease
VRRPAIRPAKPQAVGNQSISTASSFAAQIKSFSDNPGPPSRTNLLDTDLLRHNHLSMLYRIIIEQDEDGQFVAECPTLPGCISQGQSRDEAVANIKDAIAGYLASLKKHGEPIPPPITEEIVEVPA